MNASRSRLLTTGETVIEMSERTLGDETVFSADSSERLQGLLDVFGRVRCHAARAEDRLAHVHGGVYRWIRVKAGVQQFLPAGQRGVLVPKVHRDDRSL